MSYNESHLLSEELAMGIRDFLSALDDHDYRIHALMIAYSDEVIYESAAEPYTLDTPHRLFSSAKSILVLNVMKAMQEGALKATDKVADLFPEYNITDPGLLELTVDDLLTMRTGQEGDPFPLLFQDFDTDLFEAFFQTSTIEKPGTTFRYNNTVPHLVYAVAERAVKESIESFQNRNFCDPMNAPLFAPTNTRGQYNPVITCASARSFCKYAQLFLNEGSYENKEYIKPELIREATRWHTNTGLDGNSAGYGWQIWMNAFGGYRMDGGWGQYAFILPDEDAAVIVMSDMTDSAYLIEAFETILLPAVRRDVAGLKESQVNVPVPMLQSLLPKESEKPKSEIFEQVYEGEGISLQLKRGREPNILELVQNGHSYQIGIGFFQKNQGYRARSFSIDHSVYGPDSNIVYLSGRWTKPDVFEMKGKCFAEMGETYCQLRFEQNKCLVSYTPLSVHGIAERSNEERNEVVLWLSRKN